eukprot:2390768-Rhodomonas_salina.1
MESKHSFEWQAGCKHKTQTCSKKGKTASRKTNQRVSKVCARPSFPTQLQNCRRRIASSSTRCKKCRQFSNVKEGLRRVVATRNNALSTQQHYLLLGLRLCPADRTQLGRLRLDLGGERCVALERCRLRRRLLGGRLLGRRFLRWALLGR